MTTPPLEVMFMVRADPRSEVVFGECLRRCLVFADRHGCELRGSALTEIVTTAFRNGNPAAVVMVGLRGDEVVAHALLLLQMVGDRRWLAIEQLEIDAGAVTSEEQRAALQRIEDTARAAGIPELRAAVEGEARERLFRRLGFERGRVLLRKEVGDGRIVEQHHGPDTQRVQAVGATDGEDLRGVAGAEVCAVPGVGQLQSRRRSSIQGLA